jgi:hypothetical protein
MIKVDVKVKGDKYLGIEGRYNKIFVAIFPSLQRISRLCDFGSWVEWHILQA